MRSGLSLPLMRTANQRHRLFVMVLALLVGSSFAWSFWGELLGAQCVWKSGADVAQVDGFLRDWLVQRSGPALVNWNVGLEMGRAQIELTTESGDYHIALDLGPGCWTPPKA